jgi:hypothetical protein
MNETKKLILRSFLLLHGKIYTKSSVRKKNWDLYIKELTSMKIFFKKIGTLFLNSCLHELQKLNFYNHVLVFFSWTSILMW